MKNSVKIVISIFILSFLSTAVHNGFIIKEFEPRTESYNDSESSSIHISDIAGSDLYAEQINAFVAGNKSVIKQSLFTNDTSILSRFDTRESAFHKCNVLFSASNGITPELFPRILNEEGYRKQYEMTFNGFSGFLYYDEEMDILDVRMRADRALEIIKRKFEIDLIRVEAENPYFFPFVGHYPSWEIYFREVTTNLPMDGYWKALNVDRLISKEYLKNYHLSSTYLLVNSLDLLDLDITKSIDQVNFNIESLDLGYLEDTGIDNIFEQFTNVLEDFESLFGNASDIISNDTSTQEDINEFGNIFSGLNLSNESHYTSFMVQYEGISHGIKEVSDNEYVFNLWDVLGYEGASLKPSEKIYISLIGAFMSEIDVNIFCTDIIDQTPHYFTLYDFLIEQIGLLLYYAEIDFDIQVLKDYSFELFWVDEGGFKRNYIIPVNLNDDFDVINFLRLVGFQGLAGLPTGIFNPIENFEITYKMSNSEPNLIITKDLIKGNASNGIYDDFSFNITAKNIGNETAWGVPTSIPISLDDVFAVIVGIFGVGLGLDQDKDAIWEVVRIEYAGQYSSLEDFFNFDEDPLIFYFDTTGAGVIDTYFPNLNDLTNLLPYNENMDDIIDFIASGNPQLIASLIAIGLTPSSLKDTFTNEESVWNDNNWFLNPAELLTYTYDNFSIEDIDTLTPFYRYNFTIKETFPNLPFIISGGSIEETNPQMALNTDNQDWILESEQTYVDQHEIEVQFLFQNESNIDLFNNSLDSVSLLINYTDPNNVLNFEIFNYSSEEFQELSPYISTATNNSVAFTFMKNRGTLEWLFDPNTRINHTILLKIKGISNNQFNISLNDLDVEFYYRDVNEYLVLGSRVIYRSSSGLVEYVRTSNSISLSTINMASIIAYAYLDSYNSYAGEINTYRIILKNIGSSLAKDINISIVIPGIIYDPINFTIENEFLKYNLAELPSSAERQLSFSFYVPNSAIISHTSINYTNSEIIQNLNSTTLKAHPNNVYVTAPIDYFDRLPYVKTIEISYINLGLAPSIDEEVFLLIYVKNNGLKGFTVQNLNFSLGDQFGSLIPINDSLLETSPIAYDTTIMLPYTLKKVGWKGYYFPAINYFSASEQNTIQIQSSKPIILGNINFLIVKTVEKNQIEIGDIITVKITVINTGTICAKNVTISDATSFTGIEFSLNSGSLIHTIESIEPEKCKIFYYQIQAVTQALVELKPAFIENFYLKEKKTLSNIIEVKIVIPKSISILFVLGPTLISLSILIIFIWRTRKYKAKKYEVQRNELMLFKVSRSDAVLKVENTLRDRFNLISKEDKAKIMDNDKGGDRSN